MENQSADKNWYDKNYKKILVIPAVMLIVSLIYLFNFNLQHGDLILKDVSITGGTTITVFDENSDIQDLENSLSSQFQSFRVRKISEFSSGKQKGFFVEANSELDPLRKALESYLGYQLTTENSSFEFSGSTLSQGFYHQLRFAIILAFLFMAIVVFIIFRSFIPSLAVIFSAFADIVMTLAVVNFFGITLSIAGVIAFLMLIGYSVDTDILLTSRLLKRKEDSVNTRLYGSLKTGLTMTITSLAAIGVSLFIIYSVSEVLKQIFLILIIGLVFDIINTWLGNASILKWYVDYKEGNR